MLSHDVVRRSRRLILVGIGTLALAGCFRPLYGPTASGASLADTLASIEVQEITSTAGQERLGHYVYQELRYQLDRGAPSTGAPKRYRLSMTANERIQSAIVDSTTGRATAATLVGEVEYSLVPIGVENAKPITSGRASASASYDRVQQRFATVRAARDAEIRVSKQIAEQIRDRIAANLSSLR